MAQDEPFAYYARGKIHEDQQEYAEALEKYQKALSLGAETAAKDVQRMKDKLGQS